MKSWRGFLLLIIFLVGDLSFAQEMRLRREKTARPAKTKSVRVYKQVAPHHARSYGTPARLGSRQAERIQVPDENGGYHAEDRVSANPRHAREASRLDRLVRADRPLRVATKPTKKSVRRQTPLHTTPRGTSYEDNTDTYDSEIYGAADSTETTPNSTRVRSVPSESSLRVSAVREEELPLSDRELFHAHGTESARTLQPLQMSYSRVAGTDSIEGTFLLNSVNIGVMEGIQLGVNPFLYMGLSESINFSGKVNFYNSDHWAFAMGYSHLTFRLGSGMYPMKFHQNGLAAIGNYFLDDQWSFSYLAQATHSYGELENLDYSYEKFSDVSHYADVQYKFAAHWYATSGLSWSPGKATQERVATMLTEPMTLGLGASLTWKYPKSWFRIYPSVGMHYYPAFSTNTFLISAYFHP